MTRQQWMRLVPMLLLAIGVSPSLVLNARADHPEPARPTVDFDRQIRPILSDTCFKCHGPDANERQAELRLDLRETALAPSESGRPAIVPGAPERSPLVKRIFSTRKSFMMPPPSSNKVLTDEQKTLLKTWIAEGAHYQAHWSLTTPQRPTLPSTKTKGWARNPIDHFILVRMEGHGLTPAREADRPTLIRRLTLDLTGLPPTTEEVDAFLNDSRGDAYDRLVDRLLHSQRYGERMALDWLDASRYADTHGYHIDSGREMSYWRDWVIEAFNRNLPFDQFTIEQLAGDLLPNATTSQKIASGFNRNHMINFEGGAIPEEYQTAYVMDRVNTTSTVWLGLTVACAQCHDHKFDPITQKEYYQLYAFFNNLPENGLDGRKGNAVPLLPLPGPGQAAELERLGGEITRLEQGLSDQLPKIDADQLAWELIQGEGSSTDGPHWVSLSPEILSTKHGTQLERGEDHSIVAVGPNPDREVYLLTAQSPLDTVTGLRVEFFPDPKLSGGGPGRSVNGNFVLSELVLEGETPLPIQSVRADYSQTSFPANNVTDGKDETGWAIYPEVGKAHWIEAELKEPLYLTGGADRTVTTTLVFGSKFSRHQAGRFRVSVTATPDPLQAEAPLTEEIKSVLRKPNEVRTVDEQSTLRTYYRSNISTDCQSINKQIEGLRKEIRDIESQLPSTMVMQESAKPRTTFLLERGQYDQHGEEVKAGTPASLPPLVPRRQGHADRLDLARWLVDPANPLTARVTVNRIWQAMMGTGLVETAGDFGAQGALPTHPELLDWLALEFQQDWDVKALVRLIVTSATYRQSSVVTPVGLAKDPENHLLARAPRVRLHAEFIRDQALAVSGLLDQRVGGQSVSPYQPAGLWEELASRLDGKNWTAQTYVQSHGDDLYRRTMYTFWKRTSPPPTLTTFDAPDRETCTVRRARTNTPLQALVLMNDPTYVEASRRFAERILREGGTSTEQRVRFAFRTVMARQPTDKEITILSALYQNQLDAFQSAPSEASKLLAIGESARDTALNSVELAAWSMVASAILNLDETVTRG